MAGNIIKLFDFYDVWYPNNDNGKVYLWPSIAFEEMDEQRFIKERQAYRLSKNVIVRLLQEIQHSLHSVSYYDAIIVYYKPQTHS